MRKLSDWRDHFLARGAQDLQTLAKLNAPLISRVTDVVVEVLSAITQLGAQFLTRLRRQQ
jgi:hypothetical protein